MLLHCKQNGSVFRHSTQSICPSKKCRALTSVLSFLVPAWKLWSWQIDRCRFVDECILHIFTLHLRGSNQVLYNVQIRIILLDRFEDLNPFEREGHLHWLASCGCWLCVWHWHSDVEARLRADWHGWLGRCSVNFAKSRASNAAGNADSAMHVRLASGNEFWALYAAAPKSRYDALKCAFLCNIVVISRFTNEAFYWIAGCTEGGIVLSSSVQKRTAEIHVTS